MSYSDGEALILTVVKGCNNFDETNTSRCNWKVLDSGKSRHYAILRPGEFSLTWVSSSHYRAAWTTIVELWVRYLDDSSTQEDLYDRMDDLMAGILAKPDLDDTSDTILDSTITGGDEPQEMHRGKGGPNWLKWELRIEWLEESAVTFS